jgi:hypothetical protein
MSNKKIGRPPRAISERLFGKCEKGIKCWQWNAATDRFGYGRIHDTTTKSTRYAHVVSWEIKNGQVPPGLHVLHRCDNPGCINPAHLFLGTIADNRHDADAKGRSAKPYGEINPMAKLTAADIIAIRSDPRTQRAIAASYGIIQQHVSRILNGKRWGHI